MSSHDENIKRMNTYIKNLNALISDLKDAGFSSKIMGDGTSGTLYAKHHDRGVEISHADDDAFLIETWQGDESTSIATDETVNSVEAAAKKAIDWLNGSS